MFFILYKPHRKPSPKKKHEVPINDPITSLTVAAKEIGQDHMDILWDDTFIERDIDMSLYTYMSFLLKFATGDQKLNINIIQFFMM